MSDETAIHATVSLEDKEKAIQKLTEEKKALEDKNKRLASILEITAKNVSKLNAAESSGSSGDVSSEVASIKKEIGSLERKIEKSKASQSSEQLNAVLAELKTGFGKIEERMNALDKLTTLEKRLGDVQDSITLRKKSGSNLFGGLGTIGGGNSEEGAGDAGNEEENPESSSDDFGKLDEINLKIDALTKKIEDMHPGGEKHFFSDSLKKILPFTEKHREENSEELRQIQEGVNGAEDSKPVDVSGIAFKKIYDNDAKNPERSQSYSAVQPSDENISSEDIKFKVHTPLHFMDFKNIPGDIRSGHVVLLNVKSIKEGGIGELRRFVERIKRISDGISSKIMGIGEHHIIILPKNINLHTDSEKKEPLAGL